MAGPCTIILHIVLCFGLMNQLATITAHPSDFALIELWISLKTSKHTRRAYASDLERFVRFVDKPLSSVTMRDFQAFADQLGQGTLKPSSQNRGITAVKSLLSFAQQTGYLTFNVATAVKLRLTREGLAQRILDEDTVAKVIAAAAGTRNQTLLKLLYVSGMRVSEACALKWGDAIPRREGGQITVLGKGGTTRTILLKPLMWRELISLRGTSQASDPVFQSLRTGGALDVSQVRRIVYAASESAGLEHKISPHWMRHAHASHALDRHAPIHLVQATLGHASVATTGRYLHARPTESSSFYLPD